MGVEVAENQRKTVLVVSFRILAARGHDRIAVVVVVVVVVQQWAVQCPRVGTV